MRFFFQNIGRKTIVLRITHRGSVTLATIDLEGKLVGPWIDELRSVVAAVRVKDAVCLNLQHLSFADAAGLDLLRAFRRDGIHLVGASPLIEGLLASREGAATLSVIVGASE